VARGDVLAARKEKGRAAGAYALALQYAPGDAELGAKSKSVAGSPPGGMLLGMGFFSINFVKA
jgi:hypothetical protein